MSAVAQSPEQNTLAATLEQIGVGTVIALGGIVTATQKAFELSPAGFALSLVAAGIGAVAAESGWHNRPR